MSLMSNNAPCTPVSAQFTLSKCMDAVMVMGNAHMAMARTNKLAVIASHCQGR